MSDSRIIIVGVFLLALGWSVFYWANYSTPEAPQVAGKTITKEVWPDAPFDVVYLGDHIGEVKANCEAAGGTFSKAWMNWKEMKFWPICTTDHTYKVYLPLEEQAKNPCLPEPGPRNPKCDN